VVLENQYSAGDTVRIAGVEGVVEDFSLRRTVLRDRDGTVHSVPNGQITVASNLTHVVDQGIGAEPMPAMGTDDTD
jgi:small conductance mechanosensitive channel